MKVVLAATGCVTKQVHRKWERKRGTYTGKKGVGNVAELLSGEDFLVTCLGGASPSRAGSGRLWWCIVCVGLNGVCTGLYVYVCFL